MGLVGHPYRASLAVHAMLCRSTSPRWANTVRPSDGGSQETLSVLGRGRREEGITYFPARRDHVCSAKAAVNPLCPMRLSWTNCLWGHHPGEDPALGCSSGSDAREGEKGQKWAFWSMKCRAMQAWMCWQELGWWELGSWQPRRWAEGTQSGREVRRGLGIAESRLRCGLGDTGAAL